MKNLLLFSMEDLNDWIEPLRGHPQAYTPNLKRLADMGVLCTHAYAAAPACSPSRTATLFSRFPWETKIVSNDKQWFDFFPYGKSKSLIGKLKDAGMTTLGTGKVFHSRGNATTLDFSDWTEFHYPPKVKYAPLSRSVMSGMVGSGADFGFDETGEPSSDDLATDWMIDRIKPGAEGQAWALGIFRPHLPFIVPKQFFDLIPEDVSLPPGLGSNRFDPDDTRSQEGLPHPGKRLADFQAPLGRALFDNDEYAFFLRAYLASIAYADHKLGLVLDHLEQCGLMKDTLIVFWSDHGWQLGEKLTFRKFTLWERALRVPVIFAGGGLAAGTKMEAPISLVDLAPTILGLLGLPASDDFSGQDLTPALLDTGELARPYAPSIWGVGFKNKPKFAYSVRTSRYRYIRYWNGSRELYDHTADPYEHDNLLRDRDAEDPAGVDLLESYVKEIEIPAAQAADAVSKHAPQGEDED